VTADQDAARAEKVTAVLIKRCRTMLTERCRISPNNEVANSIMRLSTDQTAAFATYEPRMQRSNSPLDSVAVRRNAHRMSSAGAQRCKRGHPSGALILKPCKFAVQPVCDRRATADRQGARHMYTRSRA
jgi:hypothetical protein